jgi:hypothetical protein
MSQGIFGGMTNYEDQSVFDILEDIKNWINYTTQMKSYLEDGITTLKSRDYWNKIPFNFQMTLISSVRCQNTFLKDLGLISNAIERDQVTLREVNLMKKIGLNAVEYNTEYGKTYKEETRWKEYGNEDFKIAEKMYANGRDFFVTLQDAVNVSARLNDYINTVPPVVNQSINQTVNGHSNIIAGINNGSINKTQMSVSQFTREVDSALQHLKDINDMDSNHKSYIEEILNESKEAVNNGDLEAQSMSKSKMKSFLIGAGKNALALVNLLGTYSSIASYFEL